MGIIFSYLLVETQLNRFSLALLLTFFPPFSFNPNIHSQRLDSNQNINAIFSPSYKDEKHILINC